MKIVNVNGFVAGMDAVDAARKEAMDTMIYVMEDGKCVGVLIYRQKEDALTALVNGVKKVFDYCWSIVIEFWAWLSGLIAKSKLARDDAPGKGKGAVIEGEVVTRKVAA